MVLTSGSERTLQPVPAGAGEPQVHSGQVVGPLQADPGAIQVLQATTLL